MYAIRSYYDFADFGLQPLRQNRAAGDDADQNQVLGALVFFKDFVGDAVITSYSIHYTKLYDRPWWAEERRAGRGR